ncbi:hypothetical protein LEMA_P102170.1 [Plenodomus lingam JN3]|uniref:Haloacid dehalogenase-like hydrolase n=2 Tax=Leptosphaeria maculans TaxID=5022 RepID=E5A0M6_LEPMJ|nr:hypothetical protein LEMA_P102170.1 [Plenodomus lingam JN3]CBX97086.1 hypothetical protein LEMA_P102170.1 [Plenodomus lingam JN3]
MLPRPPIHWILDFDGTITQQDTLNTLVSISAATKPSFPTSEHWSRVTKAYLDDYSSTLSHLAPAKKLPSTLPEEKKRLLNLRPVEERSLARVSASSIFTGLTWQQLHTGAQQAVHQGQVRPRTGFTTFYNSINSPSQANPQNQDKTAILSVNWSSHFLHACLSAFSPCLSPTILANDLDSLSPATPSTPSTGHITPNILSSGDKLQHLERLRAQDAMRRPIVYVGDSWTDIEALLAADLGICVRDEPLGESQRQLTDALERVGVRCLRLRELGEWRVGEGRGEEGGGRVVWVRDWEEIREFSEGRAFPEG